MVHLLQEQMMRIGPRSERLLGKEPLPTALRGGALKLTWLCEQFSMDLFTDVQAQQRIHVYISYT